ncbi:MAG: choice-of-anchor M domain-containing protein [Planctomycetota bacterium]
MRATASTIFAIAGLTAATASADSLRLSSPVYTLTFGVDAPTPGFDPIDAEHIDFNAVYQSGGTFVPTYEPIGGLPAGTPANNSLIVNANSQINVPSGGFPSSFDFIGATPGESIWLIPQAAPSPFDRLWFGLGNEEVSPEARQELVSWSPNDPRLSPIELPWIEFRLRDVRAPSSAGEFSAYQSAGGNLTNWMATTNGIGDEDAIWVQEGAHGHYNFAFTEQGVWEIDLQVFTETNLERLAGDADLDGDVDLADFGRLRAGFGTFTDWSQGDFDGDGTVTLADFGLLRANFGQPSQIAALDAWYATVVPEPSAAAFAAGFLLLARRRRRDTAPVFRRH